MDLLLKDDTYIAPDSTEASPMPANQALSASQVALPSTPPLIYPPPELRNIIDKTAEYVSQSGPILEQRVRETEKDNPKFSFLNSNDPYNSYYLHRLNNVATPASKEVQIPEAQLSTTRTIIPEDPEAFYYSNPAPIISAQDLDVIKLTAQFVAKNGRQFMTTISHREQRNSQFDFLKPNHRLFPFFMDLVKQYTMILDPSDTLIQHLSANIAARAQVLQRINKRFEYQTYYNDQREKQNAANNKERELFNSIDWHDFVVVGTLEITDDDVSTDLPSPIKIQNLQSISLAEKSKANSLVTPVSQPNAAPLTIQPNQMYNVQSAANSATIARKPSNHDGDQESDVEMEEEDEDEIEESDAISMDSDEDAAKPLVDKSAIQEQPVNLPMLDSAAPIKIRANYTSRLLVGKESSNKWTCPVCNQEVPTSEIDEHIRIEMLDPKRKEQRESYERKIRDSNLVQTGTDVANYLKRISSKRADIFGENSSVHSSSQLDNSQEPKKTPILWDGHSSSVDEIIRKATFGATTDDQIADIHKRKGLIADPSTEKIGPHLVNTFAPTHLGIPPQPENTHQPNPAYNLPYNPQTMYPNPQQSNSMYPNISHARFGSQQYQTMPAPNFGIGLLPTQPLLNQRQFAYSSALPNGQQQAVNSSILNSSTSLNSHSIPLSNNTQTSNTNTNTTTAINAGSEIYNQSNQSALFKLDGSTASLKREAESGAEASSIAVDPSGAEVDASNPQKRVRPDQGVSDGNITQLVDTAAANALLPGMVSEDEWKRLHPNNFSLSIDISGVSSDLIPEDKMKSQVFTLSVNGSDTTNALKLKIADITGLPASKQKLTVKTPFNEQLTQGFSTNSSGLVMKNASSVASYNLSDGAVLLLGLRERGGRR